MPRPSDAEILRQIPAARAAERRERKKGNRAISAHYDRTTRRVIVELTDGFLFGFPVKVIPQLGQADAATLATVEVLPGGGGLRWEALDVDVSVPGLLLASVGKADRARELARLAGRTTSPAKATAARANGKKGGRPRKRAEKAR